MSVHTPDQTPIPAGGQRRIAVIGDVGGHLEPLREQLVRVGVPDGGEGPLPEDLIVVQLGDLVHRGPDSEGVVALVDTQLRRTPSRWIQLMGNHEAHYVFGPQFRLRERLHRSARGTLQRWHEDRLLRAAVSFRSGGEAFLVTHAGLTHGYWEKFLGAPTDAAASAQVLNSMVDRTDERFTRAGEVLTGNAPDDAAGPVWASAAEVVSSWRGRANLFSQLHGHSCAVRWPESVPMPGIDPGEIVADPVTRHTEVALDGGRIIGIDPGHDDLSRVSWRAWTGPLDDDPVS